jgi:cytoskeleton protein RodZ
VNADQHVMGAGTASVGAWLRSAREAAGLSEDGVAQQLKLAPRQVRAIEEDDFALLPGRTFVRGFVRNYARLVHLDPDAVVAALPIGEATSPLERLTYTPMSGSRDEMPMESARRGGSAARWLIPLVLLAAVGVAAYYEYARTHVAPQSPATQDGIMPPPTAPKPAPPGASTTPGTPLPNPLESPKGEAAPTPAQGTAHAATAILASAAAPAGAPTSPAGAPPATTVPSAAPAASSPSTDASSATAAGESRGVASGDAPLVLSFSGTSWVQVKDGTGAVVLSQTATAGATLPVAGSPPFEIVVGNADHVQARFRGQGVDLAPHTRSNVARVTLK